MTDDEILRAYMRPYCEKAQKLARRAERLRTMALGWAAYGIYKKTHKEEE